MADSSVARVTQQVFDPVIGALNTHLNLRLAEQNLISGNIANAETPGYRTQDIEFEQAFREALGVGDDLPLQTADGRHVAPQMGDPIHPETYEPETGVHKLDGNNVDRSQEMGKMAQNQILYDASVELLKKKLGMLKYSITEGGGNR